MSEPISETEPASPDAASSQALPETYEELLALGQRLLDEENFAEAQRVFDKALTLHPSDVVACHNRGYALERQGAHEEAMAAYEAVLQGPAPLAQSAFNLGVLLARTGRDSDAQEAFTQVLALKPDFAMAYVNLGVLHVRAGRLQEARDCYHKALELDQSCYSARLKLANLMAREGRWQEALEEYAQLLADGYVVADIHYGRAMALMASGDEEEAMQAFQHALDVDPRHIPACVQLALLSAQRQHYDRAAETLQRAAEMAPEDARVHYNLGNMHARQAVEGGQLVHYGYADAAINAYRRAIELNPQLLKAYYNLACVAEKLNIQDGITAWEQYLHAARDIPAEREWVSKARSYLRNLKEQETSP